MIAANLDPPRQTANPAPVRSGPSIRRTASIDVAWPNGRMGEKVLHGRARDLVTPANGGDGQVAASAAFEAELLPDHTIGAMSTVPALGQARGLVGESGGHVRRLIRETMPDLLRQADPLYLLLDDIPGVSLVCGWAWSLWTPEWTAEPADAVGGGVVRMLERRIDACWGLRSGGSTFDSAREEEVSCADAGELRNLADPIGWHEFPAFEGVTMRRARRIDVWRDGEGVVRIDSAFQDSAPRPDGTRAAVHEYCLRASADPVSLELLTLEPEARVLPFGECPGAVANAVCLVGSCLPEIRETVRGDLPGPRGCTHLNDALRALADVPELLRHLV